MPDLAPMIAVLIVVLALITYWPAVVMWLPNYLG
jgi:TRAP-type C4-dicarboxylate transport system permease large subunit